MARGKGASDQRLLTPLRRRSPEIRGDRRRPPDEFQIAHFIYVFTAKIARTSLRCNVCFDFFIPLSSKTPTFESFFGRLPARKSLKSRCFCWEGYEKVKKTSRDSSRSKKHKFTVFFVVFVAHAVFYDVLNAFLLNSCSVPMDCTEWILKKQTKNMCLQNNKKTEIAKRALYIPP